MLKLLSLIYLVALLNVCCLAESTGDCNKFLPVHVGQPITNCTNLVDRLVAPTGVAKIGGKSYHTHHFNGVKGFVVATAFVNDSGVVAGCELNPFPEMTYEKAVEWCKSLDATDPQQTLVRRIVFPDKTNPDVKRDAFCVQVLTSELASTWKPKGKAYSF